MCQCCLVLLPQPCSPWSTSGRVPPVRGMCIFTQFTRPMGQWQKTKAEPGGWGAKGLSLEFMFNFAQVHAQGSMLLREQAVFSVVCTWQSGSSREACAFSPILA